MAEMFSRSRQTAKVPLIELTPLSISTLALMNDPAVGKCICVFFFPAVGDRGISGEEGELRRRRRFGDGGEKERSGDCVRGFISGGEDAYFA